LITGNEKVADKILPADYMDKIFNQPEAGRDIRDRFRLAEDKIHYDINEYIKMGFKQRIVARLFHLGMPHQHEALNVPNLYRRRYVGSNEVWVYGSWVDKREINDFLLILSIYTVGLPSAVIIKAKMDSEKLNGHLITEAVYPVKMPLEQRTGLNLTRIVLYLSGCVMTKYISATMVFGTHTKANFLPIFITAVNTKNCTS
jgi:hypothetical protein